MCYLVDHNAESFVFGVDNTGFRIKSRNREQLLSGGQIYE